MKRIIAILIAAIMVFVLAACGGTGGTPAADSSDGSGAATTSAPANTDDGSNNADSTEIKGEPIVIPGKLYQLNLEDGEEPIITAVALDGNQLGGASSTGEINGKDPADEGIRFVFNLDEWIYIKVEAGKESGLAAYIVPHQNDTATYIDSFIANLSDDVTTVNLEKPAADDEEGIWGSTYVFNETNKPGYYDLVITHNLKPVAVVMLKLVPSESDMSDDEVIKLMADEIAAAQSK